MAVAATSAAVLNGLGSPLSGGKRSQSLLLSSSIGARVRAVVAPRRLILKAAAPKNSWIPAVKGGGNLINPVWLDGSTESEMEGEGKVFCRCDEGFICIITKTKGPDAGKVYIKCGEGCTCGNVTEADITASSGVGGGKVFCKCGDGFSCEIYMISDTLDAGKSFANCAEGCNCVTSKAQCYGL